LTGTQQSGQSVLQFAQVRNLLLDHCQMLLPQRSREQLQRRAGQLPAGDARRRRCPVRRRHALGLSLVLGRGIRQDSIAINTRLEKIGNRYWSPLLKRGRAIVPAAGWYEWTGEKGARQPWHVHRADGAPLYMAALANVAPGSESKSANGYTIVTADAEGGLVDVHDRRPVVLSAEDAALWLETAGRAGRAVPARRRPGRGVVRLAQGRPRGGQRAQPGAAAGDAAGGLKARPCLEAGATETPSRRKM
jgi:putative SOS response-associated peptidase YedK